MSSDEYIFLEDIDSEKVMSLIHKYNNFSKEKLLRKTNLELLKNKYNYTSYSIPILRKNFKIYSKTAPDDNHPVIMIENIFKNESFKVDMIEELEDVDKIWKYFLSKSGKYLVILTGFQGSDWNKLKIYDLKLKEYKESLCDLTGQNISFNSDDTGFFYRKFPKEDDKNRKNQKLYFHQFETNQDEDQLIYTPKSPNNFIFSDVCLVTSNYCYIMEKESTNHENLLVRINLENNFVQYFNASFDYFYEPIGVKDDVLLIFSNFENTNGSIYTINEDKFEEGKSEITKLIESDSVIYWTKLLGKYIVMVNYENLNDTIYFYEKNGELAHKIEFNELTSITTMLSWYDLLTFDPITKDYVYGITNFSTPAKFYKFNIEGKHHQVILDPKLNGYVNIETNIEYTSVKKEKSIPYFVLKREGVELNPKQQLLYYTYGGFKVILKPVYSPFIHTILELGFVVVQGIVRGGGEFGSDWHKAGSSLNKINSIFDSLEIINDLISKGYSSAGLISLYGSSNGALIVSSLSVQHPHLFKNVILEHGLYDMLRFHLQDDAGKIFMAEYGNPDIENERKALMEYSPLHLLKENKYPNFLILCSLSDNRVSPNHSIKFAYALNQYNINASSSIFFYALDKIGHGTFTSNRIKIEDNVIMRLELLTKGDV